MYSTTVMYWCIQSYVEVGIQALIKQVTDTYVVTIVAISQLFHYLDF